MICVLQTKGALEETTLIHGCNELLPAGSGYSANENRLLEKEDVKGKLSCKLESKQGKVSNAEAGRCSVHARYITYNFKKVCIVLVRFQACTGFADRSQTALGSREMQELDE